MAMRYEPVDCDLCGLAGEQGVPLHSRIVRCPRCRLLYVTPRPVRENLVARQSRAYWLDEYLPAYQAVDVASRYRPALAFLERYRRTGQLLDIGCGLGFFLNEAKQRGWQAEGVDVSPFTREYAAEAFGVEVHIGELHQLSLSREAYDGVTLWDTIEHVQSPSALLREVNRLLRPEGVVLLSTPIWNSLSRYVLGRRFQAIGPDDHIYYFHAGTLGAMLRRAGFAPVHTGSEFLGASLANLWPLAPFIRRVLHSRPLAPIGDLALRLGLGDQLLLYARKT